MCLFPRISRTMLFVMLAFGLNTPELYASTTPDVQFQVSPEWLDAHRHDENVRILDLRTEEDYRLSHIDGAVNLPIERLFANDKGKHYIASLDRIRVAFGGAGISSEVLVVVYDAGELLSATRAFWVLEVYGHERVVVLDGGFREWMEKRMPVSVTESVPQPRAFVPRVTPSRLATKLTTRLAIDRTKTVIVDVRDPDQYVGEKSVAPRSGHIPSAINIPGADIFDPASGNLHLKPMDELRALYQQIDPANTVVTYCNDGVRASATYFVLRRLGYNVANYDGAWMEWSGDVALPIVTPARGTPMLR